jgi:hypothetical protein
VSLVGVGIELAEILRNFRVGRVLTTRSAVCVRIMSRMDYTVSGRLVTFVEVLLLWLFV